MFRALDLGILIFLNFKIGIMMSTIASAIVAKIATQSFSCAPLPPRPRH